MPRILYLVLSHGGVTGGQKMALRHVEALRELGFDAYGYIGVGSKAPSGVEHSAPLVFGVPLRPDDIVVIGDDADEALGACADGGFRTLMLCQNPYAFAQKTMALMDRFPAGRFPTMLAVSPGLARLVSRAFPQAQVETIPCFVDARRFPPGATKTDSIAFAPRKRPLEAAAIRNLFRRLHPEHAGFGWTEISRVGEAEVAERFGAAKLCLSLSRLESVGLTTLEAMACGCVCAGFTGVGGLEYATNANGFWVPEDDCVAAADALAQAADLVNAGGAALARIIEAGQETAREWSYARFRTALEEVWTRLAPEARVSGRPLAAPAP